MTKKFLKMILGIGAGEVKEAWKTVGIEAEINCSISVRNEYFLNGKKISQEEARQHAMEVTGHFMTQADWKW